MIRILDSSYNLKAIINKAIEPRRYEEINAENTLEFSAVLDEKAALYIDENHVVELEGDYFDIIYYEKTQNEDGRLIIKVECEHVSYRLNNSDYDLETFTSTGTPTQILTALMNGTGFTVGTIDFTASATYSAQEKKSRRQLLMEFVASLGGEVDFDKFAISILTQRGSAAPGIMAKGKNIKVVSKIYNGREKDNSGNPLVSYTVTPIQLPDLAWQLGDNVLLIQKDLGIQQQLRIVSMSYNPDNDIQADICISNYVNSLEDQIYRIETQQVTKDKPYYGAKIGPEFGFESIKSDKKARSIFNADNIKMQVGDGSGNNWTDKLYFDVASGEFIFNGTIYADDGVFKGTVTAAEVESSTITSCNVYATNIYTSKLYGQGTSSAYAEIGTGNSNLGDFTIVRGGSGGNFFRIYDIVPGISLQGTTSGGAFFSFLEAYNYDTTMLGDWFYNGHEVANLNNVDDAIAAHVAAYHP